MTDKKHGGRRDGAGRPAKLSEPVRIDFLIPRQLLDRCDARAVAEGVKRSDVLRDAIASYLTQRK